MSRPRPDARHSTRTVGAGRPAGIDTQHRRRAAMAPCWEFRATLASSSIMSRDQRRARIPQTVVARPPLIAFISVIGPSSRVSAGSSPPSSSSRRPLNIIMGAVRRAHFGGVQDGSARRHEPTACSSHRALPAASPPGRGIEHRVPQAVPHAHPRQAQQAPGSSGASEIDGCSAGAGRAGAYIANPTRRSAPSSNAAASTPTPSSSRFSPSPTARRCPRSSARAAPSTPPRNSASSSSTNSPTSASTTS